MDATMTIRTDEFSAAARQLAAAMRKSAPNFMAQAGLDVASHAFEQVPPFGPGDERMQTQRNKVSRYLNEYIGNQRIRKKTGKKVKRNKALMRKHLIIQARRAARGMPGLYGQAMFHRSADFSRKAAKGVGFLKSLFIPIIRGLNATPGKLFRYPRSKYDRVSVWPGSDGSGTVNITGANSDVVSVIMEMKARIRDIEAGKVQNILIRALQHGINFKTGKMQRELARMAGEVVAPSLPTGAGSATDRILSQQRRSMKTAQGRAQYGNR
jgi:hypothetical protein